MIREPVRAEPERIGWASPESGRGGSAGFRPGGGAKDKRG